MKVSTIVATSSAVMAALAVALVAFFAVQPNPPTAFAADAPPAVAQREAQYQTQIAEVNRLLQERQAIYAEQMKELTDRAGAAQRQLDGLTQQETALQQQFVQLQAARAERLAAYERQLSTAKSEYTLRFEQLQAELLTAQAQLAEANAALGR